MASLNDVEKAALTAALDTTGSLPDLKKKFYNAMLSGAFDAGSTDGTLVASTDKGYYAQVSTTGVALAASTNTALSSITLTPGVWRLEAMVTWRVAGDMQIALNTSAAFPSEFFYRAYGTVSTALTGGSVHSPARFFNVTADTTIYLMANASAAVTATHTLITAERVQ